MEQFILGGYTRRVNKGLKSINFDASNGSFHHLEVIAEIDQPTYQTFSPNGKFLFSVFAGDDEGGVIAFANHQDQYQEVARGFGSGVTGAHIFYRASSQTLYVSSYHEGALDVYKFNEDEPSITHVQRVQHSGSSVHKNQDGPHVHFAATRPQDNDLMFVCDLGTDEVVTYQVDTDGRLTREQTLAFEPGTGPRHLEFHPELPIMYVVGELANTTVVVSLENPEAFEVIQTLDNVPINFQESSAGAAIRITQDGRFLYVSTRFHNRLTVFAVDSSKGSLSEIQRIDTQGEIPRDFNLNKTEDYVIVGHQDSDHLSVFERDADTGLLTFLNKDTAAEECVCIAKN